LSRHLDYEIANETFAVFESADTCYYQSKHSKVEAFSLSAFSKDTASELVGTQFYNVALFGFAHFGTDFLVRISRKYFFLLFFSNFLIFLSFCFFFNSQSCLFILTKFSFRST